MLPSSVLITRKFHQVLSPLNHCTDTASVMYFTYVLVTYYPRCTLLLDNNVFFHMQRVIQKVAWLVQHQQITQVLYISQEHCYICHSTYSLVINTNLRGCHGDIFVNCLLLLTHDGVSFLSHITVFSLKITHRACSSYVKSYHESSHCQLSIT